MSLLDMLAPSKNIPIEQVLREKTELELRYKESSYSFYTAFGVVIFSIVRWVLGLKGILPYNAFSPGIITGSMISAIFLLSRRTFLVMQIKALSGHLDQEYLKMNMPREN